jgi:hypothetical protein
MNLLTQLILVDSASVVGVGGPDGPAPLVLTEASFDEGVPRLFLFFDRAIDITSVVGEEFFVHAGSLTGSWYQGTGSGNTNGPTGIAIDMVEQGPSGSSDVLLSVLDTNGIIAVDDGGGYAGVADLVLPFP